MKTTFLLLPFLLVLLGCNATSSDKAPETFTAASQKGLAIGTITFDGDKPQNDIYRFFYYTTSGDKKFQKRNAGKIMIKARDKNVRSFTGDFNNKHTYLFVIEREPGSYAFTQYNVLNHIGPQGVVSNSKKFAIPFGVKKGEISYIGEMEFYGNATAGTPRIIVSNSMARDMQEFKKKFPNINWDAALDKTVKAGNTADGMIEFR